MSTFLALGAGAVIAFLATRSARRSARATELRLLATHLARHPRAASRTRARRDGSAAEADLAAAYLAEARESLDAEMRRVRGEHAPSLYTPGQARAAKAAMAPMWGVTMRVRP
jgi:hypothetical protein